VQASALATELVTRAGDAARFMIGLAGPPGSGKTTLAEDLRKALVARGESAVVVPMDGFHFDDIVLNARGQRARKGAWFTFDARGFLLLLQRIRAIEPDIAIPVFDRHMELSRAAADVIDAKARFIIVEGLYLLLQREPWSALKPLFDVSIFLKVEKPELERRLTQRILAHGHNADYAKRWIASNDMLNADEVLANSAAADITL
jgi:pantothenate kinase